MVAKLFATRKKEFLIKLFCVYIRSHLEYISVIWNSYKVSLNMQTEGVQRRFTHRLFGHNAPNYDDRIKLLKIPSLTLS